MAAKDKPHKASCGTCGYLQCACSPTLPMNDPQIGLYQDGKTEKLDLTIQTRIKQEIDPKPIGQVWVGFVQEMRRPCADELDSLDHQYPYALRKHTGECYDGCGCGAWTENDEWAKYAKQRQIGVVVAKLKIAGNAFIKMGVTQEELVAWYQAAMAEAGKPCNVAGIQTTTSGTSLFGWQSPLGQPTQVTSPFLATRGDHPHLGVDLRAAVGTPVVAPVKMQIIEAGFDDRAGYYVKANTIRTDGTFPKDKAGYDDTGGILTFAHLSPGAGHMTPGNVLVPSALSGSTTIAARSGEEILPTPGSILERGQQFALSGNTGSNNGQPVDAHLHLGYEWFTDNNVVDERMWVDPMIFLDDNPNDDPTNYANNKVLLSPGVVAGIANRSVAPAVVRTRGAPESASAERAVVIHNNGVLAIGRDKVTSVGAGFGNQLSLPDFFSASPGGEGPRVETTRIPTDGGPTLTFMGPPTGLPQFLPYSRDAALVLQSLSGQALRGVSAFIGRGFQLVTSPEGIGELTRAFLTGAQLGGATLQGGGALASFFSNAVGPAVSAAAANIPYVGPFVAAAIQTLGPLGNLATQVGGFFSTVTRVVGPGVQAGADAASGVFAGGQSAAGLVAQGVQSFFGNTVQPQSGRQSSVY